MRIAVVQRKYREQMRRALDMLSIHVSIDDIEINNDIDLNQLEEDLKLATEGVIKRHVKGVTPQVNATVRKR